MIQQLHLERAIRILFYTLLILVSVCGQATKGQLLKNLTHKRTGDFQLDSLYFLADRNDSTKMWKGKSIFDSTLMVNRKNLVKKSLRFGTYGVFQLPSRDTTFNHSLYTAGADSLIVFVRDSTNSQKDTLATWQWARDSLLARPDTTKSYTWLEPQIFAHDTIGLNGLLYVFPIAYKVNSVLYDSLGNGFLKWKTYSSGIDTVHSYKWLATQDFQQNITVGKSDPTGVDAIIRMYDASDVFYLDLKTADITLTNKTITFPNASGTVALTSISGSGTNATSFVNGKFIKFNGTKLISTTYDSTSFEPALTKGNLTEGITGLEFSATQQVIGGAMQLNLTTGYIIPSTTEQSNWNAAYNDKINSASFNTGDGVLTLTQQDAGTVTVDLDGRFSPILSDVAPLNIDGSNNIQLFYKSPLIAPTDTLTIDTSIMATRAWSTSQFSPILSDVAPLNIDGTNNLNLLYKAPLTAPSDTLTIDSSIPRFALANSWTNTNSFAKTVTTTANLLNSEITATNATATNVFRAVRGIATQTNNDDCWMYGIYGEATGGGINYGVYGSATASGAGNNAYGVYASVSLSTGANGYALYSNGDFYLNGAMYGADATTWNGKSVITFGSTTSKTFSGTSIACVEIIVNGTPTGYYSLIPDTP